MSFWEIGSVNFRRQCMAQKCRAIFHVSPTPEQMLGIRAVKCPSCDTPQLINDKAELGNGLGYLLWKIERLEKELEGLRPKEECDEDDR